MLIFMKYKIMALWVSVGILSANVTGCDVALQQHFFNIGFERPVEKFRTSDTVEETTPSGDEVESMEVKSFAIKGLNNVEMEYDKSRKEVRFKNKSISDTTTSTDYSSIDFNKITRLVFDGITVDLKTVLVIRDFMDKICKSGEALWFKVKDVEFKNYPAQKPDYVSVVDNLVGNVQTLISDGDISSSEDLEYIIDALYSDTHKLFINFLGQRVNKEQLDKVRDYIEKYYDNVELRYGN